MPHNSKEQFIDQINRHQNIIHKICHCYCYDPNAKKDLYQEIILQLWKSYNTFQGKSSLATWIYRVALNTAITKKEKKYDFVDIDKQQLSVLDDQEAIREETEELHILYQAIGRLKKIEKALILLWLDEKSYQDIADITGLSVKNVSVKLVRIKKKLSNIIKGIVKQ